jgi:hypothetical protein
MTQFGTLKHGALIERAVIATCWEWVPIYLRELERQHELDEGTTPNPRSWHVGSTFDRWPEDSLPCIVARAGPGEVVRRDGEGYHRMRFGFDVGAVVMAESSVQGDPQRRARELSHLYQAAIVAALTQRKALGGGMSGLKLLRSDPVADAVDSEHQRTLGSCAMDFEIDLDKVFSDQQGPVEVPEELPVEWPEISEYELVVQVLAEAEAEAEGS